MRFWDYELYNVQDRQITPGKLVWGLAILLLGGIASKRLSVVLGKFVLPRFGLNEGARNAFESLFFYLLVVTFALFSLRMVNIPLTAFTILGGALAIGFGFGSQNVVKNFISGLIILAEQPVRVGDLIQIDQLYGTVQHIGLRSTRLRTGENVEIIVPNSNFLEQNVVNWTLTDTKTRIHVAVSFVYGSNTRDVKEVLKLAVSEHGLVLKSPEPVVLFKNFGENALEFEVHFWIHMQRLMDKKTLESDIRFRIESLCREAGLAIVPPAARRAPQHELADRGARGPRPRGQRPRRRRSLRELTGFPVVALGGAFWRSGPAHPRCGREGGGTRRICLLVGRSRPSSRSAKDVGPCGHRTCGASRGAGSTAMPVSSLR